MLRADGVGTARRRGCNERFAWGRHPMRSFDKIAKVRGFDGGPAALGSLFC